MKLQDTDRFIAPIFTKPICTERTYEMKTIQKIFRTEIPQALFAAAFFWMPLIMIFKHVYC